MLECPLYRDLRVNTKENTIISGWNLHSTIPVYKCLESTFYNSSLLVAGIYILQYQFISGWNLHSTIPVY